MIDAEQLKMNLRVIIGATVTRVGLLVWPAGNGLDDTDVRLYLELRRTDGNEIAIIFRTSPDGQTPALEWMRIPDGIPLSDLKSRQDVWSNDAFWTSQPFYSHELFLVSSGCDEPLAAVNDQRIIAVFVICFAGDEQLAAGIRLRFGDGTEVWTVPGRSGSQVIADSTRLCWPDPIVDCEVVAV